MRYFFLMLAAGMFLTSAVEAGSRTSVTIERGPRYDDDHRHHPRRGRVYHPLKIPKAYLPPPGMTRLWFPGLPPRKQPPPGYHRGPIPDGAVLIRRPRSHRGHIHVYEARSGRRERPGYHDRSDYDWDYDHPPRQRIRDHGWIIRVHDVESGSFIRVLVD